MEPDKRPKYIWISVILANILFFVILVCTQIYRTIPSIIEVVTYSGEIFIPFGIFAFMSVVPVFISRANGIWKNYVGYDLPILLLLPVPYFIWHYFNCTGKLCNIGDPVAVFVLGPSAIIFGLSYFISLRARIWNARFIMTLIGLECCLIFLSIIWYFYLAAVAPSHQSPMWWV